MKKKLLEILNHKLGGNLPPRKVKELTKFIEKEFAEEYLSVRILNNFRRIIESDYYFSNYLQDTKSFQIYFDVVLKTASFSNYLTDIVVRNPEYLSWCLSSNTLYEDLIYNKLTKELSEVISTFTSFERKVNALIRFKRRILLKIGLRDILGIADITKIVFEYSMLSRVLLNSALAIAINSTLQKFEIKKLPTSYSLVALGKLGGNELNYSSDVDLMFFYDKEISLSNKLTSSEIFELAIKTFIDICSNQREEGYLFRTDFRLRPDGKYSPLCRSLDYYLLYYESRGREWERQMLLKSDFIGGDENLFLKFNERIQNFVYPRSLFTSPREVIKKFKESYSGSNDQEKNIKHFPGGIRDIEFSVQALQLLNGGINPTVRTSNTLSAIEKLTEMNFISLQNFKKLTSAYKFFRIIENYLQLMNDKQSHTLPNDKESVQSLIHFLGLKNKNAFESKLQRHRNNVNKFYGSIFGSDKKRKDLFASIKFNDLNSSLSILRKLKSGATITDDSISSMSYPDEFDKISHNLFNYLRSSLLPDKTLTNLFKIITSSKFPILWYEFLEQKKSCEAVLTICELSDMLVERLCADSGLRDFVLSGKLFLTLHDAIQIKKFDLHELKLLEFYLAFNFLIKNIRHGEAADLLVKFFFKAICCRIEKLSEKNLHPSTFVVIGMGSFGCNELTIFSDLDLIFIFDETDDKKRINQNYFVEILSSMRLDFSHRQFFEIDSRLRPEGRSSQLGWEINHFEKYAMNRMRIWELQAYTKGKLIYGSEKLYNKVKLILNNSLKRFSDHELLSEVRINHKKLKAATVMPNSNTIDFSLYNGGIVDLQFLIQYLVLLHTKEVISTNNSFEGILLQMKRKKIISSEVLNRLKINYKLLWDLVFFYQITSGKKKRQLKLSGEEIILVQKYFKMSSKDKIVSFIEEILDDNIKLGKILFK
ncbi:MAG: hypothetical protein FJ213_09170 [Ignavibacteria bacterium]|nr:hypothetical protein [Ignavibacteria bacterium]